MATEKRAAKPMNVFLWVLQIALATVFVTAGVIKATQPKAGHQPALGRGLLRGHGHVHRHPGAAGRVGLILPAVKWDPPILTPVGATSLAIVTALAVNAHRRRHKPSGMTVTAVLFVAAVVVAWGRFGQYSF